jgi:hypothetical protein
MSYTKPDQSPFTPNLIPGELVVQLDTGDFVAITANMLIESNSGNPACVVSARAVDSTGLTRSVNNAPITSEWCHTTSLDEINQLGGVATVQKECMLAILGEPTTIWDDPIHLGTISIVSIRNNLMSAKHAGVVMDVGNLL